jgi:phage FluMu gp28-like protein
VTVHQAIKDGLPLDIAQLKAGLANPEAWSQEYECQFIDNSTVLLPYSLIEQSESAEATETAGDLSRCTGEIFVGIDFGRRNDLTACWVLERVGQELWTREVLTLDRMPTTGTVRPTPAARATSASRLHRLYGRRCWAG